MQFFTFVTALVLAVVAVSATPTGAVANTVRTLPSFDETLAKITLAHPGLSADEHQGMTDGFLDAVAQVSSRDNSLGARNLFQDRSAQACCKRCDGCGWAIASFGWCCNHGTG